MVSREGYCQRLECEQGMNKIPIDSESVLVMAALEQECVNTVCQHKQTLVLTT